MSLAASASLILRRAAASTRYWRSCAAATRSEGAEAEGKYYLSMYRWRWRRCSAASPLWYGVTRPESASWPAKNRINAVMNGPSARVREIADRYMSEWKAAHSDSGSAPKLGTTRHIHVADTDAQAEETARRGYAVWFDSNAELFRRYGTLPLHFPSTYDEGRKARDDDCRHARPTVRDTG